jgi:hypothetical protein
MTFNSGTWPNAGGVNRASDIANNTEARFIRTPHVPAIPKLAPGRCAT